MRRHVQGQDTLRVNNLSRPARRETPSLPAPEMLPSSSAVYEVYKRGLDLLLASVALVLAGPFILASAAIVRLTSRGPAFYSQVRVGLNGRLFRIHKLRTMIHNCESLTGPRWAIPGDPRITPVGEILRLTHLDELPQLWNVVRGEMTLVGPRPERPEFVAKLERLLPRYRERLRVKPGVTGLAQVHLPADADLASVRRKLSYDLYYIRNRTLGFDLRIAVATSLYLCNLPTAWVRSLTTVPRLVRRLSTLAPSSRQPATREKTRRRAKTVVVDVE